MLQHHRVAMRFFGIDLSLKRHESPSTRQFRRISPTVHIAEYCGVLPSTRWAEHHLWCVRIEPNQGRELVRQGYAPLGSGLIPSHSVFCVAKVGTANQQTRYCFGLYFALGWTPDGRPLFTQSLMDATAERIASKLAHSLYKSTLPSFTLRCLSEVEYPWCLSTEAFDQHWQIEAGVWYRHLTKISFNN